jgi:RimK family alpha-L-glutamate ligase
MLTERGHTVALVRPTRTLGRIDGGATIHQGELDLASCDVALIRGVPAGSLEQLIFRIDTLHLLAAAGVTTINTPRAIERTVDKFLASALLARAGVATPRTVACQMPDDAFAAFTDLGGDVAVKQLFGAMGFGMTRLEDPDVARRVFRALALERAVYYLQEMIPHDGCDVRAFVVGSSVVAAIERSASDWRLNLARGAKARPIELGQAHQELCVRAAGVLGAEIAGVDLLRASDGREYVLEVNGIPGWQGLERVSGVSVTRMVVKHIEWLARRSVGDVDQLPEVGPRDGAPVQGRPNESPGGPGATERLEILDGSDPAPGQELHPWEAAVEL